MKSLSAARKDFFSHSINDSLITSKSRWLTIRSLLHSCKPAVCCVNLSANMFCQFFNDKLSTIAVNIANRLRTCSPPVIPLPNPPPLFSFFSPVSVSQVDSLLLALSKPSPVDIIHVSLLKSCHSTFSVLLSRLADISFVTGKFPDLYKLSQISPLLKKPSLDPSDLSSYRPISNLRTIGKLLERLAQLQLRPHFLSAPAFSPYQSPFRPLYSTETATILIANNLLRSSSPSLLVFLDLSSVFDCVSHSTLLHRLSQDFGLTGPSLSWLHSYLSGRSQYVFWNDTRSTVSAASIGVPQGSVLGPLLFCAYVSPIYRLLGTFGRLHHHLYTDDTTLILSADFVSSPLSLWKAVFQLLVIGFPLMAFNLILVNRRFFLLDLVKNAD